MQITKSIAHSRKLLYAARKKNKTVGFVPTMGALHEGHLSLIRKARLETGYVVASIFINPLQFGPTEDLRRYPRNIKKDTSLLKKGGADLIFYPTPDTMYSQYFSTYVNETMLSKTLCAASRPDHFKGVVTVVSKLFNIVQPDIAYFGQKDYQQALIIKRLVKDLDFDIKIKVLPIVRDSNGLALSSRNTYLTPEQYQHALLLNQSLSLAKKIIRKGECDPLKIRKQMDGFLSKKKYLKIDYIEIVNPITLQPVKKIYNRTLIMLAVYAGSTRLIDNIIVNPQK